MRSELRLWIARARRFVDFDTESGEREFAAVGHGVASVEREVHDDLIDIAGVGKNRRQVGRELHVERDVFADEPAQHGDGLLDDFVERERPALDDLFAAVGEQLAGQGGGALRGALDLVQRSG